VFGREGGTGVNFENGDFAGVSIGSGVSESMGGLTGSADGTVFVGKNPNTGKWDLGLAVTGAAGIGFEKKVNAFGNSEFGLGVACYPGSASAKFYARGFYDDAVTYIVAAANRPN